MFTIRAFDPLAASAADWAAYHRFRRSRGEEDDPGEPLPSDADTERDLTTAWPLWRSQRFLAWDDAAVIGLLGIGFRREGTADYADFAPYCTAWGGVTRPWRRRGVATALLRPLADFMAARGKARVTIDARLPEGHAFLAALGAEPRQVVLRNRLALDRLDLTALAAWEAAVPPELGFEVHGGRVPPDRLAALLPRFTQLFRDVPMGSLDVPAIRYELPAYRAWYAEMDRHGGAHLLVLLRAGEEVVAMCEGSWDARYPDRAYQLLTAVDRDWRGRGLAGAVKARMLRLVREELPQARLMETTNAESNAPILALNRRLGFTLLRRVASYQVTREELAAQLPG